MAYNFLGGHRDQPFLLPPDLRDWLPEGHLAWFLLDVVDQLDPAPLYRQHRDDGHGHPADDPRLLLGVLLYAYCVGVRSSRQLERRCTDDLAFRVLAANQTPRPRDHRAVPGPPRAGAGRLPGRVLEAVRRRRDGPSRHRRAGRHQAGRQRRRQGQGHNAPAALKRRPQEAPNPEAVANVTDPDSRFLHTRNGTVQGYNAQAVTTMHQRIVAAELTDEANDVHPLDPMLHAAATTLAAAGIDERPETALADSGYWSIDNLTTIPNAPELYIPPAKHGRQGKPRKDGKPSASRSDGLRAAMTAKLTSEDGKARYAKRRETVEPVFGQIKEQQGARRFLRRGMRACEAEWKLLCGTHNLLKLWRHTVMRQAARPATA
jgi:hypothetical protein